MTEILLNNLAHYWLQAALAVSVAAVAARILRIRSPRFLLCYWQAVLAGLAAMPFLQPWRPLPAPLILSELELPLEGFEGEPAALGSAPLPFEWTTLAMTLIMLGFGLRLAWLCLGLIRLRLYRRRGTTLQPVPQEAVDLCRRLQVQAEFRLSPEIDIPATYGLLRPVVILPQGFFGLSERRRRSLLCHELLHVRRRDWFFVLLEESAKSIFWFHPAVWWLCSRIQLAREQTVDRQVVGITGDRKSYLHLLLETAESSVFGRTVPAPSFFRPSHLSQRIALLTQEVTMSRLRSLAVSTAAISLLLFALWGGAWAFPLTSPVSAPPEQAPQTKSAKNPAGTTTGSVAGVPGGQVGGVPGGEVGGVPGGEVGGMPGGEVGGVPGTEGAAGPETIAQDEKPLRVGGAVMSAKLLERVEPQYPQEARDAQLSGIVFLNILVDESGSVADAQVVRGHPSFNKAALEAVKQWRYEPVLLNGQPVPVISTITVNFRLKNSDSDQPRPRIVVGLRMDEAGELWKDNRRLDDDELAEAVKSASAVRLLDAETAEAERLRKAAIERLNAAGAKRILVGGRFQVLTPPEDQTASLYVASSIQGLKNKLVRSTGLPIYRVGLDNNGEIEWVSLEEGDDDPDREELMRAQLRSYLKRHATAKAGEELYVALEVK